MDSHFNNDFSLECHNQGYRAGDFSLNISSTSVWVKNSDINNFAFYRRAHGIKRDILIIIYHSLGKDRIWTNTIMDLMQKPPFPEQRYVYYNKNSTYVVKIYIEHKNCMYRW